MAKKKVEEKKAAPAIKKVVKEAEVGLKTDKLAKGEVEGFPVDIVDGE